jgi:3-oxoacyl-[acyl-carrier protein] reductase
VLTKYVARTMMAEGAGRIVKIASIVGFTGYSGLSVYAATKAAMRGFTRSLAREVGRLGITVNAVAPGFLDTEMTHGLAEEQRRKVVGRSALRRLAGVDDVAKCRRVSARRQGAQHFWHGFNHRRRRNRLA